MTNANANPDSLNTPKRNEHKRVLLVLLSFVVILFSLCLFFVFLLFYGSSFRGFRSSLIINPFQTCLSGPNSTGCSSCQVDGLAEGSDCRLCEDLYTKAYNQEVFDSEELKQFKTLCQNSADNNGVYISCLNAPYSEGCQSCKTEGANGEKCYTCEYLYMKYMFGGEIRDGEDTVYLDICQNYEERVISPTKSFGVQPFESWEYAYNEIIQVSARYPDSFEQKISLGNPDLIIYNDNNKMNLPLVSVVISEEEFSTEGMDLNPEENTMFVVDNTAYPATAYTKIEVLVNDDGTTTTTNWVHQFFTLPNTKLTILRTQQVITKSDANGTLIEQIRPTDLQLQDSSLIISSVSIFK